MAQSALVTLIEDLPPEVQVLYNGRILLRISDVVKITRFSRATVYRLIERGILPVVRIPGIRGMRVDAEDLNAVIRMYKTGAINLD